MHALLGLTDATAEQQERTWPARDHHRDKVGPGLGSETGIYRLFSQVIVAGHHPVNQRLANSGLPSGGVVVCVCVCVCVPYGLRMVFLF